MNLSGLGVYMKELEEVLERLGLRQYLEVLTDEGFERWETVLDITEQDLYVSSMRTLCLFPESFHLHACLSLGQS